MGAVGVASLKQGQRRNHSGDCCRSFRVYLRFVIFRGTDLNDRCRQKRLALRVVAFAPFPVHLSN
jgi:hypothetical protein